MERALHVLIAILCLIAIGVTVGVVRYQIDPEYKARVDTAAQQKADEEEAQRVADDAARVLHKLKVREAVKEVAPEVSDEEIDAAMQEADRPRARGGLQYGPSINSKGEFGIGPNFSGFRF